MIKIIFFLPLRKLRDTVTLCSTINRLSNDEGGTAEGI